MASPLPEGVPAASLVDLYEQAADWSLRRRSPGWSSAEEGRLQSWLDAAPLHRQAFEQTAATQRLMQALAQAEPVPGRSRAMARSSTRDSMQGISRDVSLPVGRRRFLPWALAASLLLAAAAGGIGWWSVPLFQREVVTALGETRHLDLPDGSTIDVNVASSIEVRYFAGRREVRLDGGEAFFAVASDARRPFMVKVGDVRIRVIGTAFNVQATPQRIVLKVQSGEVRVMADPASRPEAGLLLGPNGTLAIDRASGRVAPGVAEADAIGGWRSGQIRFRRTPLVEVAEEIARYAGKPVDLATPELARLPVSGFFATTAPESFIELLPGLAPVTVNRRADGGWTVSPATSVRR